MASLLAVILVCSMLLHFIRRKIPSRDLADSVNLTTENGFKISLYALRILLKEREF